MDSTQSRFFRTFTFFIIFPTSNRAPSSIHPFTHQALEGCVVTRPGRANGTHATLQRPGQRANSLTSPIVITDWARSNLSPSNLQKLAGMISLARQRAALHYSRVRSSFDPALPTHRPANAPFWCLINPPRARDTPPTPPTATPPVAACPYM